MFRAWAVLSLGLLLFLACRNQTRNKEQVQAAIIQRLQTRTGLDLHTIDVTTTSVVFTKDTALATVAFHPKGDPNVNSGMVMKYALQERNGKWVVTGIEPSRGHGGFGSSEMADPHAHTGGRAQ